MVRIHADTLRAATHSITSASAPNDHYRTSSARGEIRKGQIVQDAPTPAVEAEHNRQIVVTHP
jgi:hypothetical protein